MKFSIIFVVETSNAMAYTRTFSKMSKMLEWTHFIIVLIHVSIADVCNRTNWSFTKVKPNNARIRSQTAHFLSHSRHYVRVVPFRFSFQVENSISATVKMFVLYTRKIRLAILNGNIMKIQSSSSTINSALFELQLWLISLSTNW